MESYIVGRIVRSESDGILSSGGLPGLGSVTAKPAEYSQAAFDAQYAAYSGRNRFLNYTTYNSQICGQGMLFGVLDRALRISPSRKLRFFYAVNSFLAALVLTAIVIWFLLELGTTTAICVLLSFLLSQWLVVFARNLWWSTWAFFVPMAVTMHYLRTRPARAAADGLTFSALVFVATFVKCVFNGYEYITTTVVMALVPCGYYGIRGRWSRTVWLRVLSRAALGVAGAVLVSMVILCFQIAAVESRPFAGVDHIVSSFAKRTHAAESRFPPEFGASLRAGTLSVVGTYFGGAFFEARWSQSVIRVPYLYLVILFAAMSLLLYLHGRREGRLDDGRKRVALVWATWLSSLAPLSWFVIFKAHSYIHTHMNFIVWQMPFVAFGFAVCGCLCADVVRQWRS